ncbi:thioredoxin family protein [Spirochaetota bacterium]
MKDIKVLGTGCPKCAKLEELSKKAAEELGIEHSVEKVKDINKIMDYGVMTTPALVVDGKVKVAGKVPSLEEIKNLIK